MLIDINTDIPINIHVYGVGGTGSLIISRVVMIHNTLVELGYPGLKVQAIDFDTVSESNLKRQNFYHYEIGKNKAKSLIGRINLSYNLDWSFAVTDHGTFNNGTISIICVDNNNGYSWVIDCGNNAMAGQLVLFHQKHQSESLFDLVTDTTEEKAKTCAVFDATIDQSPVINAHMADLACALLWKMIYYRKVETKAIFTNLDTFKTIQLTAN